MCLLFPVHEACWDMSKWSIASYGSPKWLDPMGEEFQQEVAFQNIATWLMEDVNKHGGCTQTEKDQCTCI